MFSATIHKAIAIRNAFPRPAAHPSISVRNDAPNNTPNNALNNNPINSPINDPNNNPINTPNNARLRTSSITHKANNINILRFQIQNTFAKNTPVAGFHPSAQGTCHSLRLSRQDDHPQPRNESVTIAERS